MAKESNRSMIEFKNHGIVALGERIVGTTRSTIQKIVDSIAGPLLNNPFFLKKYVREATMNPNEPQRPRTFCWEGTTAKRRENAQGG
jgi:hypothetical protein